MRQKYMIKTGPHEPNDRLQYLNCRPNRAPSPFELANLFELAQIDAPEPTRDPPLPPFVLLRAERVFN